MDEYNKVYTLQLWTNTSSIYTTFIDEYSKVYTLHSWTDTAKYIHYIYRRIYQHYVFIYGCTAISTCYDDNMVNHNNKFQFVNVFRATILSSMNLFVLNLFIQLFPQSICHLPIVRYSVFFLDLAHNSII